MHPWLYPIYLATQWLLPGSLLRGVSLVQHTGMLVSVIPVAYIVRKVFPGWRWWIVPASFLVALHPHFLYYSDQVLAEAFFLMATIWTMAGWVAWTTDAHPVTRLRFVRFLYFLIPLACVILLKPSGRMFWPGVVAALLLAGQWRALRWPHYTALALLLIVTPTVGKSSQGTRLLYTSTFPMTQLDTDLHRELKAEIAPMVKEARRDLRRFYRNDSDVKDFLEKPERYRPDLKLWVDLDQSEDEKRQEKVYWELAMEGLLHQPHLIPVMIFDKIVSSHVKGIKLDRFLGIYQAERMAQKYYYPGLSKERPELLRKLFGLPEGPLPEMAWFQSEVAPHPSGSLRTWFMNFCAGFEERLQMVHRTEEPKTRAIQDSITVVGVLTLIGLLASFLPAYLKTLGAISLMSLSYLCGVFAVGSTNPRFLVPIEPWTLLLLLFPGAVVFGWIRRRKSAGTA